MNEIAYNVREYEPGRGRIQARPYRSHARSNAPTVYVLDRGGLILETNEVVEPLTGYGSDELVGQRLSDYLDPLARTNLEAIVREQSLDEVSDFEAMIICRDGRERPVRGQMAGLHDEDGRFSGLVLRLERALVWLAPQDERPRPDYEELVDLVSDAVMELSREQDIISLNLAGRKMFGYTPLECKSGLILDLLFDPLASDQPFSSMLEASPEKFPLIAVCRRKDGRSFVGRISVQGILVHGREGGWRLIIQELASHRDLARWARGLYYAAGLGRFSFALLDREGRLLLADPLLAGLFGYGSGEEMTGFPLENLIRDGGDQKGKEAEKGKDRLTVGRALLKLPAKDNQGGCRKVAIVALGEFQLVIVSAGDLKSGHRLLAVEGGKNDGTE
jgi:PAS domain S-box-containing protein